MNYLDRFFYGWISPVINYANKHTLSAEILEDLSAQEQSQHISYEWMDHWNS